MGGARHPDRDAGDLRRRAVDCGRHHRHGHDTPHRDAAEGGGRVFGVAAMTFDIGMPMIPEAALFGLMVLVLLTGVIERQPTRALVGWLTVIGVAGRVGLTVVAREGATLFSGSFVDDSLAIFAKKLLVAAAALSVLRSHTHRQRSFQ